MKKFTNLFRHFVVIAFCVIVAITLLQVFMRYVLVRPLTWAEEFSRYVFVWAVMISIAICGLEGDHICLNMVTTRFGKKAQLVFLVIDTIIMGILAVVLLVHGGQLSIMNMSVSSPAMRIPIGIAYLGIPVGAVVILLFLILNVLKEFKAYRDEKKSE